MPTADPDERDMELKRPGSGSARGNRAVGNESESKQQSCSANAADNQPSSSSALPPAKPPLPPAPPRRPAASARAAGACHSLPRVAASSAGSSRRNVNSAGGVSSSRGAQSTASACSRVDTNRSAKSSSQSGTGSLGGGAESARDQSVLLAQQLLLERQYWATKYTFSGLRARIERRLYQRELTAMWSERTEHSPYWSNQARELEAAERRVERWRVASAKSPRQSIAKLCNTTRLDEVPPEPWSPTPPAAPLTAKRQHSTCSSGGPNDPSAGSGASKEATKAAVWVFENSPQRSL
jgi:hypothetical protein